MPNEPANNDAFEVLNVGPPLPPDLLDGVRSMDMDAGIRVCEEPDRQQPVVAEADPHGAASPPVPLPMFWTRYAQSRLRQFSAR